MRSSDRSSCTSTRPAVLAPPVAVPRRQVAAEPLPRARRDPDRAVQPRVRGDGRVPQRALPVPDRGGRLHRRPRSDGAGSSTSSTPAPGAYTGRTWAVRDRHRRQRDRRRLHDRRSTSWCSSSATTSTVPRRSPSGSTGSSCAAPTARATSTKTLVVDLLSIANPDRHRRPATATAPATRSRSACSRSRPWCQLRDGRLLVANDNNYPGNAARDPGTPDDTEMIIIDLRTSAADGRARRAPSIGHRGASGYRPEHTLAVLRDGHPAVRRLHRARRRLDQGRRPRRPARERDRRHHRRRRPRPSSPTAGHQDHRRASPSRAGSPRTSRSPSCARCGPRSGSPASGRRTPRSTGGTAIPTLDEVLDLARHSRTCDGRAGRGLPGDQAPDVLRLDRAVARGAAGARAARQRLETADAPVIIQSFETGNLRQLDRMTNVPLAQLIDCSGAPYDLVAAGDPRTYADLVTRRACADRPLRRRRRPVQGRDDPARHATAPARRRPRHPRRPPRRARRARLDVPPGEPVPARWSSGSSADPNAVGDLAGEIRVFLDAGMDGFFTDNPDIGVAAAG